MSVTITIYRTQTVGRDNDNRYCTYGGGEWTTDEAAIEAQVRASLEARAASENLQRKRAHDAWERGRAEYETLVAAGFRTGQYPNWEPPTELLTADDVSGYEDVLTVDSEDVEITPGSLSHLDPNGKLAILAALEPLL